MNLYDFLLVAFAMAIAVGVYLLERKERQEILNRFMAKDLKEYNYYDKKFKQDIVEEKKIENEARLERDDFRKDVKAGKDEITPDSFVEIPEEEEE
jgi:hypothetical protein